MAQKSAYKSIGRKSITASAKPRDLMGETPDLARSWRADVITLFPEAFPGPLGLSLLGGALKREIWQLHTHDLRPFGKGKHRNVDDTPAGGGAGMVMRADVMGQALSQVLALRRHAPCPIIYMSPRGIPLTQARALELSQGIGPIILCGRFEGIDERVIEHFKIEEISIGDYVLTGGELAAQVLLDTVVRLIPGVLGNQDSLQHESFSDGLLEHPQYTRPATWQGRDIPPEVMAGNHIKRKQWQQAQSEALTRARRPDLWDAYQKRKQTKNK